HRATPLAKQIAFVCRNSECRNNDDVLLLDGVVFVAIVRKETNTHRLNLVVHVLIVKNPPGEENWPYWKLADGFVGVFNRALEAVTEPELQGEEKRQVANIQPEAV